MRRLPSRPAARSARKESNAGEHAVQSSYTVIPAKPARHSRAMLAARRSMRPRSVLTHVGRIRPEPLAEAERPLRGNLVAARADAGTDDRVIRAGMSGRSGVPGRRARRRRCRCRAIRSAAGPGIGGRAGSGRSASSRRRSRTAPLRPRPRSCHRPGALRQRSCGRRPPRDACGAAPRGGLGRGRCRGLRTPAGTRPDRSCRRLPRWSGRRATVTAVPSRRVGAVAAPAARIRRQIWGLGAAQLVRTSRHAAGISSAAQINLTKSNRMKGVRPHCRIGLSQPATIPSHSSPGM